MHTDPTACSGRTLQSSSDPCSVSAGSAGLWRRIAAWLAAAAGRMGGDVACERGGGAPPVARSRIDPWRLHAPVIRRALALRARRTGEAQFRRLRRPAEQRGNLP